MASADPDTKSDIEQILTDAEGASQMLGVPVRKVRELAHEGEIPSVRLGRKIMIPIRGLRETIARLTVPAGGEG